MKRRRFVTTAGASALVTVAGCSSGVITPTRFSKFEQKLKKENIDVESTTEEKRRWVLEYYPREGGGIVSEDFATIVKAYAEYVPEAGPDQLHRQLDVLELEVGEDVAAKYTVPASTAREYRDDEISSEELVREILIESVS